MTTLAAQITELGLQVALAMKGLGKRLARVETVVDLARGEPGMPGKDGESVKGDPGPPGKDGESIKGDPGPPGKDGKSIKGDPGSPGKDGRGVKQSRINADGDLIVTYDDGTKENTGRARGKDGVTVVRGSGGLNGVDAPKPVGIAINDNGDMVFAFSDGSEINAGSMADLVAQVSGSDVEYPSVKLTAAQPGDNLLLTCPAGKRIVLRRIVAIADPDAGVTPVMSVKLGAEEVFRSVVVSIRQKFTGPANGNLVLNLSEAASVPVTAFYELVDA